MKNSIIKFKQKGSIAHNSAASYVIKSLTDAASKWFQQDPEFIDKLCYMCKKYEKDNESRMVYHNQPAMVYTWSEFFRKFKPSDVNIGRTLDRILKGEVLQKTENQNPSYYYVGASEYPEEVGGIYIDGMHTRAVEHMGRVLGIITPYEEFCGNFVGNVVVIITPKTLGDYRVHKNIVITQDAQKNCLSLASANRAYVREFTEDTVLTRAMCHHYAFNQKARERFWKKTMIDKNEIQVFELNQYAARVLITMTQNTVSERFENRNKELHSDILYPSWVDAQEHFGFETAKDMPDTIFGGVMRGASSLLYARSPAKIDDVIDTLIGFMNMNVTKVVESNNPKVYQMWTYFSDAIHCKHKREDVTSSLAGGDTMQSYLGDFITKAFMLYHEVKEDFRE